MNPSPSGVATSTDLASAFRAWLATPDQTSAFLLWLAAPSQEGTRQTLMERVRAEVAPDPDDLATIALIPVLGPFQEQPDGEIVKTPWFQSRKKGRLLLMADLGCTQQFRVSCLFQDRKGNPAQVQGVPEWLTDNSELLALFPAADGMSCLVRAVGPMGTARITLSADADLGTGVRPLIGTLEINITGGSATVVRLEAGAPEEQPEEPPTVPPTEPGGTAELPAT